MFAEAIASTKHISEDNAKLKEQMAVVEGEKRDLQLKLEQSRFDLQELEPQIARMKEEMERHQEDNVRIVENLRSGTGKSSLLARSRECVRPMCCERICDRVWVVSCGLLFVCLSVSSAGKRLKSRMRDNK